MMKASVVMKPHIWSQLPPEVMEHILLFLPLKSLFNLRSTCKRFYTLIFSPSFISQYSSIKNTHTFSSFLLLSHPQFQKHFPVYDSAHAQWRMLSLPSSAASSSLSSHLLSVSNGLLCFSLPSSSSFLISNLLLASSRVIQSPIFPFVFESVTLISSSNQAYKIVVLCSGSRCNSAFIYDSLTASWTEFTSIIRYKSNQEGVYSNGHLYFTTPEPFFIVGMDLKTGVWRNMVEELPGNGELTFARMAAAGQSEGEEKLYLIGGIGRHGISRSLKLWEKRADWVEVGSLPELMCKKFMSICYHNYEHVYCFCHDGVICVCCYTWPEILCYKIGRQTWHWLPKCPSLSEKCSCGFRWFSFVPNLYALV